MGQRSVPRSEEQGPCSPQVSAVWSQHLGAISNTSDMPRLIPLDCCNHFDEGVPSAYTHYGRRYGHPRAFPSENNMERNFSIEFERFAHILPHSVPELAALVVFCSLVRRIRNKYRSQLAGRM